jgi:hypothetical protein
MEKDYLVEFNNDIKPLIITFAGLYGGISQPLFEFKNFLLKNIDCHVIFIRDTNQLWYNNGAIGLGTNINELKNNIQEIINKINYSTIITIGGSMGGYAALLFGSLLPVNGIIAFGPQTFIDKYNRKKYKDFRWRSKIKNLYNNNNNNNNNHHTYYDLSKLSFQNINVKIIYGYDSVLDKKHAKRMKNKNIIVTGECGGHGIVKNLRDNGKLLKIIDNMIIDLKK